MPRIPYVYPAPGENEIADKIRERRGLKGFIELDGVLLNAPAIAGGFSDFLGAIRDKSSLPADLRELMILRVAALNGAVYEWRAHEPIARSAGFTTPQLREIALLSTSSPSIFSPLQAAALAFTDASTKFIKVPQPIFDTLLHELGGNRQQMMECSATIGAYALVSRILVAMDVGDLEGEEIPVPEGM